MSLNYKPAENLSNVSLKRQIDSRGFENFGEQQKSKIETNDKMINCLKNISVAYKSGNTVRLLNQLSYFNKVTMEHYIYPNSDFFNTSSNSIPDILMKISFDKSSRFSLNCKLMALSIIDNLTFEKIYGFLHFFYELDIINIACISLFSDNLNLILYSLRILLNYCENQKDCAEEILLSCPLDHFVTFILGINADDQKLVKRVEDAMLSLMCELSFVSSDEFTPCFYASIHCLLQQESLFVKENEYEKYIFWIAINCIKSDNKCIDQFYDNANLMNLISNTINNQNDDIAILQNFKSAVILLANLYQKNDFMISDLNILNIMNAISVSYSDDLLLISLLRVLKVHVNQPQFCSLVSDSNFISILSKMFFQSSYSIKLEICHIFCLILQFSTPEILSLLIHEHIIQIIYEIYISDVDYLKNILLISITKLLHSATYLGGDTRSLFSADIDEIDFDLFDENQEKTNEDQIELIANLKESMKIYQDYINNC